MVQTKYGPIDKRWELVVTPTAGIFQVRAFIDADNGTWHVVAQTTSRDAAEAVIRLLRA